MIKDCLLLDAEQSGYLGKLEVGWAIAKIQGRWFKPFLLRFPLLSFEKGNITDEIVTKHMKNLLDSQNGFSVVISGREGISTRISPSKGQIPPVPAPDKRENKKEEKCAINLTTKEREFLEDVLKHPTSSIVERYKHLNLSPRKGNNIQKSLLSQKLLSPAFIFTGKSRIKTLKLSLRGRKALGLETGETKRHGGMEHQYWKNKVAERLRRQGYTVHEEYPIGGGKTIDLVAEKDGKRIAIEIETGKSDVESNIQKCLNNGFKDIRVVFTKNRDP